MFVAGRALPFSECFLVSHGCGYSDWRQKLYCLCNFLHLHKSVTSSVLSLLALIFNAPVPMYRKLPTSVLCVLHGLLTRPFPGLTSSSQNLRRGWAHTIGKLSLISRSCVMDSLWSGFCFWPDPPNSVLALSSSFVKQMFKCLKGFLIPLCYEITYFSSFTTAELCSLVLPLHTL